jgi:hypothetical protein
MIPPVMYKVGIDKFSRRVQTAVALTESDSRSRFRKTVLHYTSGLPFSNEMAFPPESCQLSGSRLMHDAGSCVTGTNAAYALQNERSCAPSGHIPGNSFTRLNNTQYISEETRARVLKAVREFNYFKNVHAQRLATGRSDFVRACDFREYQFVLSGNYSPIRRSPGAMDLTFCFVTRSTITSESKL